MASKILCHGLSGVNDVPPDVFGVGDIAKVTAGWVKPWVRSCKGPLILISGKSPSGTAYIWGVTGPSESTVEPLGGDSESGSAFERRRTTEGVVLSVLRWICNLEDATYEGVIIRMLWKFWGCNLTTLALYDALVLTSLLTSLWVSGRANGRGGAGTIAALIASCW